MSNLTEGQRTKLRALADRLILMAAGLTSKQSADAIAFAEEYAPLAEYVINQGKAYDEITDYLKGHP